MHFRSRSLGIKCDVAYLPISEKVTTTVALETYTSLLELRDACPAYDHIIRISCISNIRHSSLVVDQFYLVGH